MTRYVNFDIFLNFRTTWDKIWLHHLSPHWILIWKVAKNTAWSEKIIELNLFSQGTLSRRRSRENTKKEYLAKLHIYAGVVLACYRIDESTCKNMWNVNVFWKYAVNPNKYKYKLFQDFLSRIFIVWHDCIIWLNVHILVVSMCTHKNRLQRQRPLQRRILISARELVMKNGLSEVRLGLFRVMVWSQCRDIF